MVFQFSSFPLLITFFLFLFMLIKKGRKSETQSSGVGLPPGPWKLPVIGNIHHLVGALPHHSLCRLAKKHGPVMHLKLGQVDHIVISSPEAAKEVMKTHDINFAYRPELVFGEIITYGYKDLALSPYGNYWRQLKKICVLELLSARRVKMFAPLREEEISNLVRYVSETTNTPINLTEKLLTLSNMTTSRAAFGKECKHHQRFIRAGKETIKLASGFNVADLFPSLGWITIVSGMISKLKRIRQVNDEILDEIMKEHEMKTVAKKTSRDEAEEEDFVDVLLKQRDGGELEIPLTVDNIKAVILDMFLAGTETSSTTIEWAIAELMNNPKVMEKAQAQVRQVLRGKAKIGDGDLGELHYLKLVIKETLRLHPPLPLLVPRVCHETCRVGGYRIPAGTRVIINCWALGRDPKNWDDAESFKPERFDGSSVDYKGGSFEYLPFGAGRRICPGMAFGLASVELVLAQLLFYFNWELPNGMKPKDLDMTETFGATAGRKSDLCLLATPYIYPAAVCMKRV